MIKKTTAALISTVVLASQGLLPGVAAAQHYGHHRGHHHDRRYDHDRRHWRGGHHGHWDHGRWRRDDAGAALAAGALGLVLGAAIRDSQTHRTYAETHRQDRAWLAHCEGKYRSFDAASGTYLGYDGDRHYCQ